MLGAKSSSHAKTESRARCQTAAGVSRGLFDGLFILRQLSPVGAARTRAALERYVDAWAHGPARAELSSARFSGVRSLLRRRHEGGRDFGAHAKEMLLHLLGEPLPGARVGGERQPVLVHEHRLMLEPL